MADDQPIREEPESAEIIQLFATHSRRVKEPPPTAEELAEYRRIRPLLLQMLREWDVIKGASGCPIAARLLDQ